MKKYCEKDSWVTVSLGILTRHPEYFSFYHLSTDDYLYLNTVNLLNVALDIIQDISGNFYNMSE